MSSRSRMRRNISNFPLFFEDGPNGPLVPELKELFPDASYIARPGQINAWDNEDFVKAVRATGRRQLLIAGVVTEVCVAFPALSALEEGYEVFVVTDASGTFNKTTREAAWSRMCEDSLRRLRVETIDLYQIHWPVEDTAELEEGWAAMAQLQREGKVRWIGVSNFNVEEMKRGQALAPITSLQPPYSLNPPRD